VYFAYRDESCRVSFVRFRAAGTHARCDSLDRLTA
jgi:hypothetical protein